MQVTTSPECHEISQLHQGVVKHAGKHTGAEPHILNPP